MLKDLLIQKAYALEEIPSDPIGGTLFNDLTLASLFTWLTNLLIMAGLGLVLVFLTTGFIKFITSKGDKVETEAAQKWITYAVIGGAGLFAVFAVKTLVINLVGGTDPIPSGSSD